VQGTVVCKEIFVLALNYSLLGCDTCIVVEIYRRFGGTYSSHLQSAGIILLP
jgi:hypothetical protein